MGNRAIILSKNDMLAASDAYDTAANLLLSKVEAEGTTTVEK